MTRSFVVASSIAACSTPLLAVHCANSTPIPAAGPQTLPAVASPGPSAASSPAVTGPAASATSSSSDPQAGEEAHRLVIAAAGCWTGGTWSDAFGEGELMKQKGIEARCHDLERRVWSGAEDRTHYEQLRAFETNAVADVIAKVDETAKRDRVDGATRDALLKLTSALADEERELMLARRAADRVKRDLDREPEKLTADEADAVVPLRAHAKLEALLKLDAGVLSKEAHALALLRTLDRVELARGLPKHLKLYAVADEFHILFGVTIPDVPQDATKKLVSGTWLQFLSQTAAAAGYPVGDKAKTPREKDALAWAGMLHGFSDQLKADDDAISPSTDFAHVVAVAIHRLEAEYSAQKAAEETLRPAPAKRR